MIALVAKEAREPTRAGHSNVADAVAVISRLQLRKRSSAWL